MRLTLRAPLFRLVPVCLATFWFSQSIDLLAQTNPCELGPTSCERSANSRFFQMAVWTNEHNIPGFNWESTVGNADIHMFGEGQPQPPGRSIMLFKSWSATGEHDTAWYLAQYDYDWNRVLAAVIDEPYSPHTDVAVHAATCSGVQNNVAGIRDKLMNAEAALHAVVPEARLWVNFTQNDLNWMRAPNCALPLNDSVFDVVSLDRYDVPFSSIQDEYDWFISEWPQQQLALVPGVFFSPGGDPYTRRNMLYGYFDYANRKNQRCDMDLGRAGRRNNFGGCRVWVVAGWPNSAEYVENQITYFGLFHPYSTPILATWHEEFAKLPRFGPRTLSSGELRVLELLED